VSSRISASICERSRQYRRGRARPQSWDRSDSVTVRSTQRRLRANNTRAVTAQPARPDGAAVAARTAFGQRSSRTVGLGDLSSAEDEPTEDELESVAGDADADSELLVAV
jgi:hypothetical protein